MDYLSAYIPILVLLLVAGVMCLVIGILATKLGPRRITRVKETAFECGSPTTGDPHARHSVKFYLVALLFIVFDIESVFIYPWGALLRQGRPAGVEDLNALVDGPLNRKLVDQVHEIERGERPISPQNLDELA